MPSFSCTHNCRSIVTELEEIYGTSFNLSDDVTVTIQDENSDIAGDEKIILQGTNADDDMITSTFEIRRGGVFLTRSCNQHLFVYGNPDDHSDPIYACRDGDLPWIRRWDVGEDGQLVPTRDFEALLESALEFIRENS